MLTPVGTGIVFLTGGADTLAGGGVVCLFTLTMLFDGVLGVGILGAEIGRGEE